MLPRLAPSPRAASRVKDRRESDATQRCERAVADDHEQLVQRRRARFLARWHHVRVFFAAVSERLAAQSLLLRSSWLRDWADALRDATATSMRATLAQLQSTFVGVVQRRMPPPLAEIETPAPLAALPALFAAFELDSDARVDVRQVVCALLVLQHWRDGEMKMLSRWLDEFASERDGSVRVVDLAALLCTACASSEDEAAMLPFVRQLSHSARGGGRGAPLLPARDVLAFVDAHPPLRALLKSLCWRRLTDDTRLGFYRELYREALERLEAEETRCRTQLAVQLWRLREPRLRFARWKAFTAWQKLLRLGERHFSGVARRKALRRLVAHRGRRQQLRVWLQQASATYALALSRWTVGAWKVFVHSTRQLHDAAARRSQRKYHRTLVTRAWKGCVLFLRARQSAKAQCQARVDAFVARRQLNECRRAWADWVYFYRRRKEVRGARDRERALHDEISQAKQEAAEVALMALEDAASRALQQRERELVEAARRRAFDEAAERVYENRKLKAQEDERRRLKQEREQRLVAEMNETWARIDAKVAVEVRAATLAWFDSDDGQRAVQAEASEIFERDPVVVQKALLQNAEAFSMPGCRWQLRLEDYGGRYAKAFYLNVETLEKHVCDELVMEDCEKIAREVLIQRRIDQARARLQAKAGEVARERQENAAALKIQMLFRCRHALLVARSRIRTSFVKRIEPATGDVVYFNLQRQEARRRPPRLIGSDEPLISVESSTWVRRLDDDGNNYYQHLVTGETSWSAPPHHALCVRCRVNFATRRWNEGGGRYCIVCYAEGLKKHQFGAEPTWTKISVQPLKCVVCRNSLAVVVCHECRGDATCWRDCRAVHRHPSRRTQKAWTRSVDKQRRETAMAIDKEQAEQQKQLGNEEFNVKNFAKAIEHYSEAIRLDSENHIYYSNRSAAYGAAGQWELAEEDAKQCVRLSPGFAKGYHRLANAQKQLGKNAEALATLKAAQSSSEADKVPGIKKLMRDLSVEGGSGMTVGGRVVPPAIAKELQELQPQVLSIQRELEQVGSASLSLSK
ncbi:hypothetical protein P43SY_009661 [Pythium insidiosum]|uniref:WW domain-containing protein n=1 Tax=Pythium insidiosum TaxID=114742 RepID=A0AAD5Q672_PYTIN|nr:hypothetical protein P43SY_009661 [Pythium insidiosum]